MVRTPGYTSPILTREMSQPATQEPVDAKTAYDTALQGSIKAVSADPFSYLKARQSFLNTMRPTESDSERTSLADSGVSIINQTAAAFTQMQAEKNLKFGDIGLEGQDRQEISNFLNHAASQASKSNLLDISTKFLQELNKAPAYKSILKNNLFSAAKDPIDQQFLIDTSPFLNKFAAKSLISKNPLNFNIDDFSLGEDDFKDIASYYSDNIEQTISPDDKLVANMMNTRYNTLLKPGLPEEYAQKNPFNRTYNPATADVNSGYRGDLRYQIVYGDVDATPAIDEAFDLGMISTAEHFELTSLNSKVLDSDEERQKEFDKPENLILQQKKQLEELDRDAEDDSLDLDPYNALTARDREQIESFAGLPRGTGVSKEMQGILLKGASLSPKDLQSAYESEDLNLKDFRFLSNLQSKATEHRDLLNQFNILVSTGKDKKIDDSIDSLKMSLLSSEDPKAMFQNALTTAQQLKTERNNELLRESKFYVNDVNTAKTDLKQQFNKGIIDLSTALTEMRKLGGV